jgi:hypothetical protein
MRTRVLSCLVIALVGCSSRNTNNLPTLKLMVASGAHTPSGLDWLAVVGDNGGEPFTQDVSPELYAKGQRLAAQPWHGPGDAHGVVISGRSDGTAIAQAFASTSFPAAGGTLSFTLGGDLLTDPIAPVAPTGSPSSALVVVDHTVALMTATPTLPVSATLHLANVGSSPSSPLRITGVGPAQGDFSSSGCDGESLLASTACDLSLVFKPAELGNRLAALVIDAGTGGMETVVLVGKALRDPAFLVSSDKGGDFGDVPSNASSAPRAVSIHNDGETPSSALQLSIAGDDATAFALDKKGCTGSDNKMLALDAGASCNVNVTFTPTHNGTHNAKLEVSADRGGSATFALSGNGTSPLTLAVIGSGDGGPLEAGLYKGYTFTIKNTGSVTTGPLSLSRTNLDANVQPFYFGGNDGVSGHCYDQIQLAAGATCIASVSASSNRIASGTTVTDTAVISGHPGGRLEVPLSAQVGHFVEITMDGHPMGDDVVIPSMQTPADVNKAVIIHNVSQTTLTDVNVYGFGSDWLTTNAGDCTAPLGAGASCTFQFQAHGSAQSYGSGTNMGIYVRAAGDRRLGVGVWISALQLSRARIPPNPAGTDLIISNVSSHDVSMLTIANSSAHGFNISTNNCGTTLPASQSCKLSIVYSPTLGDGYDTWKVSALNEGTFPLDLALTR